VAKQVATAAVLSDDRVVLGAGAGWMREEFDLMGQPFQRRGARFDEMLDVLARLWTGDVVEHHGEFFEFPPVAFEPKPVQRPHPPIVVGGESDRALRRAASSGDGWIGMEHTPESAAGQVALLRAYLAEAGRPAGGFTVTVSGAVADRSHIERWEEAGVDRLIVTPWKRSRDAIESMKRFAELAFG
jgi:probable F420-dependent oxidoreductase